MTTRCTCCELCYEKAVSPGVWPVAIDKRKDGVSKALHSLLPLARAALGVAKIVNRAAGVARVMGYPVPSFQLDGIDLSIFKHDSSLQGYSGLEQALFDAAKSSGDVGSHGQLEGYSQREFARFLAENDQKDDWGKLKRILLDEGCAMWCCQKCCDALKVNPKASYKELRASMGNPVPVVVAEERFPLPPVQITSARQSSPPLVNNLPSRRRPPLKLTTSPTLSRCYQQLSQPHPQLLQPHPRPPLLTSLLVWSRRSMAWLAWPPRCTTPAPFRSVRKTSARPRLATCSALRRASVC